MTSPSTLETDPNRLAALRSLSLLDTPAEERFDRLTRLASQYLDAPMAGITLVDANRLWFKSRQGIAIAEIPLDCSFCRHALSGGSPLLIADALADPLFADHPLVVGAPGIRAYAGVPLVIAGGQTVGTLCVLDTRPRVWDERTVQGLADLAAIACGELVAGDRESLIAARDAARSAQELGQMLLAEAQHVARLGSFVQDEATGRSGWSDELYRICGRLPAPTGLADESFLDCVLAADRDVLIAACERLDPLGQPIGLDLCIERSDGALREVHVRLERVSDEWGRPQRLIGTVQDITERKAAERELADTRDRALEASRLKSEFLSIMSHEIRTPLSGVIGMTELLLDTELASNQREFASVVLDSAQALLGIINDILDFSKIEAGKLAVESIAFEPIVVAESAAELIAAKARQKNLSVLLDLDPAIPAVLLGDPGRLRQVLLNLLNNAVKFTLQGEVLLRVSLEAETAQGVTLRFDVRDTGIGLSADQRDRLFEPFVQADGSTTREFGGTGLGLSICKRLVALMGGDMGLESEPDRGSTFWFTLTLARDAAIDATPRRPDLAGLRVLVADPHPTTRGSLRRQLAYWGASVSVAASRVELLARIAESRARRLPYDAILIDHRLGADRHALAHAASGMPDAEGPALVLLTELDRTPPTSLEGVVPYAGVVLKPVRQASLYDCLPRPNGASDSVRAVG